MIARLINLNSELGDKKDNDQQLPESGLFSFIGQKDEHAQADR
jgi:hypothetical protein